MNVLPLRGIMIGSGMMVIRQLLLLWMDEILHHLTNPGIMIPLQIPTNSGFPDRSVAKWISSIHRFRQRPPGDSELPPRPEDLVAQHVPFHEPSPFC